MSNTSLPAVRPARPRRDFAARLFGYDVFISFALGPPPRGSLSYASDLARRLRERDFTVYFSEDEAPPGDELDGTLRKALHGSRTLVIIANRGTLADPRWVRTEVESFRSLTPERPIIPISIGGALQDPELSAGTALWLPFKDRIWLDEASEAGQSGVVSIDVVDRLTLAPTRLRSNVKWRWLVRGVGATLLGLVISLGVATKIARDNERSARAGELAARATASMAEDPDQAMRQALASLDIVETAEGERVLRRAVQEASMTAVFDGCPAQNAEFGPGGRYVLIRCGDGSARLWDSVTAQQLLTLAGTAERPVIAQWAADESALYVADADGSVRALTLPEGREMTSLPAGAGAVVGMLVNPSLGQVLIWREADGLRAYAPPDFTPLWHNSAPATGVRWVKASRDGAELAVLWPDPAHDGLASVRYFDSRTGELLAGLGGEPEIHQRGSIFDSEGRRMLRLGDDEISEHWNAVTWDLRAGKQAAEIRRPAGRFWAGAIDEEGNAYIGYWGNVVQVWLPDRDGGESQPWTELSGHSGRVIDIDLRMSDRDRRVLTASEDGTARLWRPTSSEGLGSSSGHDESELRVLRGHRGPVTMARFSPDGNRALTVGIDGTTRVWRLEPNHLGPAEPESLLNEAANADGDAVRSIPVDAGWRRFVLQQGQHLRLVERDSGRVACDIDTAPLDLAMPSVHVDSQGRRLLLVHEQGGRAVLFDLAGCSELRRFSLPGQGKPMEVVFNRDATAALLRFDEYRVLDLDTGHELGALLGAEHIFEEAAFVGDERAVLAKDAWGEHLVRWSGPPYGEGEKFELPFAVQSFVVSPDRRLLAAIGGDGQTALVDAITRAILQKWTLQASELAFSADSARLAAVGLDGSIRVWSVRDGSVLVDLSPYAADGNHEVVLSSDGQRLVGNTAVWAVPGGQRLDVRTADSAPWIDGLWFRRETSQGLETIRSVHRCLTCAPLEELRATARQRLARRGEGVRAKSVEEDLRVDATTSE